MYCRQQRANRIFANFGINVKIKNYHRRIAYRFGIYEFCFIINKLFDCLGVIVGRDKSCFYAVFTQSYVKQIKRSAVNSIKTYYVIACLCKSKHGKQYSAHTACAGHGSHTSLKH